MATTTASSISQALTFKVQKSLLRNLRARLFYADSSLAEDGDFDAGHDQIAFASIPDLAINTTALTEGTPPTPKALSLNTILIGTTQYGDTVEITDVAKVKSPFDLANTATERLSRQAAESIDQITRDVVAAGGTPFYAGNATTRAGIDSGDTVTATNLMTLRATMFKGKIPLDDEGYYRLVVSPEVALSLRTESTAPGGWQDVNRYTESGRAQVLKGEVGRIHGFRVMEVVNAPTVTSSVTVHLSLALGSIRAWGAGELQTLRTYHVSPGGDHSDPLAQKELMGWKVMFGVAVLNNGYYYRLESAATAL